MIAFLLILLGAVQAAPAERDPSDIRREVERVLKERHPTDTPEWWRGLGSSAPDALIGMYGETTSTHRRARLLQGLGWFSEPRAVEFVKQETVKAENKSLRKAGIRAVGAAGRPEDSEFLAGFLKDADPNVRLAAAVALSHREQDPSARSALEQYRGDEKIPWVLERLDSRSAVPAASPFRRAVPSSGRSPDFAGEWKGFWIAPRAGRVGLAAREAALRLVAGRGGLAGAITFTPSPGEETALKPFDVKGGVTQGERLQGEGFSAEVRNEAGRSILRFDVPALGAVFVAERAREVRPPAVQTGPTGPTGGVAK